MGKMTPGFKFLDVVGATVVVFLSCSLFGISVNCDEADGISFRVRTLGIVGVIFAFNEGSHYATAYPPQGFHRRLGSPMPELGRPVSMEDEDSDEDDEEGPESGPRIEPQITPLNRDQCLAKLLCGMSVPVTGGNSKKNYYSEYANIVSKFFEAFPLDDELQSKESMESYDDYSNEDDGKPIRMNSKRKSHNSSKVEDPTSKLQLFELALVDVAKPEDLRAQNRTKKETVEKVSRGNRMARARKIVENLGQKLQTVRQCQSINGCPFSFKQLRETLKKKEAQRVSSSNIPLPGPIWPPNSKRKEQPRPASYKPKPYINPEPRPKPNSPSPKPSFSDDLFPPEKEPIFPHRDTNKGDDELEEIFGPPNVSKRPMGFHHGVDENFNYEYNSEKPWRPGSSGGNSYNQRPWQVRPRPKPFNGPGSNGQQQQRPPPRPRPQNGPPGAPKRPRPPSRPQSRPQSRPGPPPRPNQQQNRKKPEGSPLAPVVVQQSPKRPGPPAQVTTTKKPSPFPKRKISYLSSPYKKPGDSGEDDEGTEDINKVAPVELIGNLDAGEYEPTKKTTTTTTTEQPAFTEASTSGKKKDKNNDDSDEYDEDEDDYYDEEDDDEVQEEEEEDEEDYSDEEEDEEKSKDKEKKKKRKKQKNKKKKGADKNDAETVVNEEPVAVTPKIKTSTNKYYDDENEGMSEIWTKLNYATTGANYKPPAKLKKKNKYTISSGESDEAETEAPKVTSDSQKQDNSNDDGDDDDDDDDEEDDDIDEEEEGLKGSLTTLKRVRASSSSNSNEDDADDEVEDENQSKRKKSSNKWLQARPVEREETYNDEQAEAPSNSKDNGNNKSKKVSGKTSSKKKKKTAKPSSDEEDEKDDANERRKNIMMEIGGRPLVPKPDHNEKSNAQKTSSLIANRFKFQFINPYGPAPPQGAPSPMDLPGSYPPPRMSYGPNHDEPPPHGGPHSSGNEGGSGPGLPFKFKLNPGPLGNLAGGPGGPNLISLGGFGNHGGSSGSLEMPDPHHPPPPTPFMPHHNHHGHNSFSRNDPPQQHFSQPPGFSGSGMGGAASSLFKLNPLPALSNLFKNKPSHDSMPDGHSAPPMNAFIHRPVGPESSQYRRDRLSPASGSSNPASKKDSKGSSTKKSKGSKKAKS